MSQPSGSAATDTSMVPLREPSAAMEASHSMCVFAVEASGDSNRRSPAAEMLT